VKVDEHTEGVSVPLAGPRQGGCCVSRLHLAD
jgi:hypothetical protein